MEVSEGSGVCLTKMLSERRSEGTDEMGQSNTYPDIAERRNAGSLAKGATMSVITWLITLQVFPTAVGVNMRGGSPKLGKR